MTNKTNENFCLGRLYRILFYNFFSWFMTKIFSSWLEEQLTIRTVFKNSQL